MNILIVYATNSGSTYLVSRVIVEILTPYHTITVKKVIDMKGNSLDSYDLVILGSPSWEYNGDEGMPHQDMIEFMKDNINKKYSKTKFAVFGCGDSSYTNFCGAVLHLEEFVQKTGGKLVTDSLRIDGFFFDMDKSINLTKEWTKRLNDKINGLNYTLLKNDDDEQKNALLVRLQQLSNIPLSERLIN